MIRIGLLGAGWHAVNDHAPALRAASGEAEFSGGVALTGVCDADAVKASAVAREFGFGCVFETLEAMLPRVDAIVSVVPPGAMLDVVKTIIRSGRPVLIEKPLGTNLADAALLAQMLDGHPHMVSLNRRFDPAVAIARRWINEQSSPPRAIHGVMTRRDRVERDFIWSTGIHLCDLMCFLVGPLNLIAGNAGCFGAGCVGLLRGTDGLSGTVHIHPSCGRVEEVVDVFGGDWSVHITTGTQRPWNVQCWKGGDIAIGGGMPKPARPSSSAMVPARRPAPSSVPRAAVRRLPPRSPTPCRAPSWPRRFKT